ncbi:hypothetical protein J6590_053571 [Homalodisca vitripennis]|nr:hypothetical protein J6590_053571 [Homalodisca vitripennis]
MRNVEVKSDGSIWGSEPSLQHGMVQLQQHPLAPPHPLSTPPPTPRELAVAQSVQSRKRNRRPHVISGRISTVWKCPWPSACARVTSDQMSARIVDS